MAMIEQPLALAGIITVLTAAAFWLERNVPVLSRIGAGMIAIVLGALLSNLDIVPAASPVYVVVGGPVTSLAIAWLLLAVDIGDVRRVGPRLVGAFALACLGTVVGAMVGALSFATTFGDANWQLAGTLTGTYTGGSVNFVSVGRAVGLSDALFAGATAADNLTTGLWLGATLLLPIWLARFYPAPPASILAHDDGPGAVEPGAERGGGQASERAAVERHPFFVAVPLSTLDIALLFATGFALLIAADRAAALMPVVPGILWLTTFALIAGHLPPLRRAAGALQLGNLALLFFFVIIGIHSRIADIVAVGIGVFWFTAIVVIIHGLIVFGIGRMLRFDIASLAVASQAAVGGPSSALAVAVAREWPGLVVPGIVIGLLGYATGNYLGLAVAQLVRAIGL